MKFVKYLILLWLTVCTGAAIAELNRNVSTDKDTSGALTNKFDATRVQNEVDAQTQITQTFGQQAAQAIGTLAQHKTAELKKKAELATSPEQKQQLLDEAAKWDEGGRYRVALHTVAGAMSGGVAGAASAATVAGSANLLGELQSHIQAALTNAGASESVANITSQIISQAAAAGLGGTVGTVAGGATGNTGTGAIAGIATGLNVDANNRQLHPDERKWAKDKAQQFAKYYKEKTGKSLTAEQAQNMLLANGYRLVDNLASKGPGGDITAKQFIAENSGNLFQASATERANPFLNGNADSSLTPEQLALPGAKANPALGIGIAATAALGGLSPSILQWALSNPIAATNAGVITAETAAAIISGAVTPSGLLQQVSNPKAAQVVYNRLATAATKNPQSNEVVLGKYVLGSANSYEKIAQTRGATYYVVKAWDALSKELGNREKMWEINKAFLDKAISEGKNFVFTSDPRKFDEGFAKQEFHHLINMGYEFKEQGGLWHGIKK